MRSDGLVHAVIAGIGFGRYFIILAQVDHGLVFGPLTFAMSGSLTLAVVILLLRRDRVPMVTVVLARLVHKEKVAHPSWQELFST